MRMGWRDVKKLTWLKEGRRQILKVLIVCGEEFGFYLEYIRKLNSYTSVPPLSNLFIYFSIPLCLL